ncbi:MAG TPA: hypothetical protein VH370_16830 [Humisphaera sp.]|nr:hypothetical protein [Humisphaera sp.]
MKLSLPIFALAFLLVMSSPVCFGMMDIELVTPQRAKELGMVVKANAAGPDTIRISLEFPVSGELKSFSRADLEIMDGGKLVLAASLREEKTNEGHVIVSFAVARDQLDKLTLRVVSGVPRDMVGHDLRLKEFVDLKNLK